MGMLSRLKLLFTIGVTLFDMGSDIILAVDYYKTGEDWWWFTLTLIFFLLPVVVLALIGFSILYYQIVDSDTTMDANALKAWKVFECMAESGPQLILQLYIMALPNTKADMQQEDTNNTCVVNTTTQPYSITYETTPFNSSMYVTEKTEVVSSDDGGFSLTLILQIITVITSLLSISWGATSFKAEGEEEDDAEISFETMDYIMDLVWNILCISARILALSLFATVYRYWFAGIVTFHITIIFIMMVFNRNIDTSMDTGDWVSFVIFSLGLGIGYLLNILMVSYNQVSLVFQTYVFYFCYWMVLMIETTILISIWYAENQDNDLWYNDVAIAYVITAYSISVAIKTFHVSTFQQNKGKPIWKWVCTNINMTDDEENESETEEGGHENNISNEPEVQESVA